MANKNIVLFSDGTNNKGGVGRDTNVYRLYKMLDNDHAEQLAFYDDGVGTQSSTPMKMLGLVIGWGLSKNVLDLYLSLISHYEKDAHIYLFGFSRGAFTVRMLANLIDYAGVPSDPKLKSQPQALRKWAEKAMNDYKAAMQKGDGHYPPDNQRCHSEPGETNNPQKDPGQAVEIRCVGVWDTVNATGFPINSFREWWGYKWIQDVSVARLPQCVKVSFHALAIDEERLTFAPTLWNETTLQYDQYVEQVWFAGVHSNVGGGYPKDGLAQVSLEWMISRLEALPTLKDKQFGDGKLYFNPTRQHLAEASDINGKQYDSRSGAAVFYRYKPRDIAALTKEAAGQRAPLIHQAVLQRIGNITAFYAPYMVRRFRGVDSRTDDISDEMVVQTKYSSDNGEGDSRVDILHSVNARAVVYWLFFVMVCALLILPWLAEYMAWFGKGIEVWWVSEPIRVLNLILPDMFKAWVEWYALHPAFLAVISLSLIINRLLFKNRLESRLAAVASDMWLNLNKGVLQFSGKGGSGVIRAKVLPKDDTLQTRELRKLRASEQAILKLERVLSQKLGWRSE